jgi:hypothetical protein
MESVPSLARGDETPRKKVPLFLRRRPHPLKSRARDSAAVAHEISCYLRWAQDVTEMTFDEIIVRVMDRALSDYLRRDGVWRALRSHFLAGHDGAGLGNSTPARKHHAGSPNHRRG